MARPNRPKLSDSRNSGGHLDHRYAKDEAEAALYIVDQRRKILREKREDKREKDQQQKKDAITLPYVSIQHKDIPE